MLRWWDLPNPWSENEFIRRPIIRGVSQFTLVGARNSGMIDTRRISKKIYTAIRQEFKARAIMRRGQIISPSVAGSLHNFDGEIR